MGYTVCLVVAAALAVPALATALPSLTANPANKMLGRGIDPIRYDVATHCNGGKIPSGTKAMLGWLEKNASGVNWGEYRCEIWGKKSASLHSVGRAIDWHPTTMADGYALVKLLLASDSDGNPAALARRMGVQGLIFNCKSWFGSPSAEMTNYSYCYDSKGRRKSNLDPTQAHMNHVHIELNELGAAKKTTFWNKKVNYPVQNQTPVPPPRPQVPQPQAPPKPSTPPVPPSPSVNSQTGGGQYDSTGGSWSGPGK
jgi:hypothetical protein